MFGSFTCEYRIYLKVRKLYKNQLIAEGIERVLIYCQLADVLFKNAQFGYYFNSCNNLLYKQNLIKTIFAFASTVHTVTLFLNIFGCLAWFYVDATRGVDFGLSILWFLLFTPCSFVCWYRPLYGAFR